MARLIESLKTFFSSEKRRQDQISYALFRTAQLRQSLDRGEAFKIPQTKHHSTYWGDPCDGTFVVLEKNRNELDRIFAEKGTRSYPPLVQPMRQICHYRSRHENPHRLNLKHPTITLDICQINFNIHPLYILFSIFLICTVSTCSLPASTSDTTITVSSFFT